MNQRQIKFRVWDSAAKIWLKDVVMDMDGKLVNFDGVTRYFIEGSNYIKIQFTGLYDKNGKEIWEGDVLKILQTATDGSDYYENFVIEWDKKYASFEAINNDYSLPYFSEELQDKNTPIEVIGNIYENPELIGDGE